MSSDPNAGQPAVTAVEREIGQIARGAGVGMGGNLINYAISYLFGILIARQVGADAFGLYTLGVTATNLISRFTLVGLDRGLMRFAAISRGRGEGAAVQRLIGLALLAGGAAGLAGGALFWFAPGLILSVFTEANQQALGPLMPYFAFSVPALTLTSIAIAGTVAFRTIRYRALVVNVIQPIVKLLLALLLLGILGAVALTPTIAFTLTQLLGTALALFFLWRLARGVPRIGGRSPGIGRQLARFSLPLLFTNVLDYLNGRTEILVLGIYLAASASGIYSAAGRLAGLGLIVLTAFNAIFSPLISDLHARGQVESLATLYKLVARWIVAVAMPLFVIQIIFAPQLMALFGPDFVAGAAALRILSLGQLVNFATGSAGIMLIMSGRSDLTFLNSLITVALALALDFLLVPRYGLGGAAVAGALVIALINLLRLAQVWLLMRIHPFTLAFAKPFLAAAPTFLAGWAWLRWLPLHNIGFLFSACLTLSLLYLALLLLLGLDEGDRMLLAAARTRARRFLP